MVQWNRISLDSSNLAKFGTERLHGRLSYLATVRKDGSPRVFPVVPFTDGFRLFVFVGASSPKRFDLRNDRRFSLHCAVEDFDGGNGEFSVDGIASLITEPEIRRSAVEKWPGNDPVRDDYLLYELLVSTAMGTQYENGKPARQQWTAG